MTNLLRVGLVQHACTDNKQENLDKSIGMIRTAANSDAKLVILQELHAGPYFCVCASTDNFDYAETIPGPTTRRLAEAAKACGVVLVGSIFELRAPGVYHNTAVVFEPTGELVGTYRKMHIPDDPGFYEKFYFTPGDLGFEPIKTSVGMLGVLVCWDQWFPEAARLMAMRGAELLIYPTAIGWDPRDTKEEKARQRDAWMISQRGHAVANGLPVCAINRVGLEPDPSNVLPGSDFWGTSFVAGPQGEILAVASEQGEEVLMVDIDMQRSTDVRRIWPFFRDRRIDAYGGLLERFLK